VRFSRLLPRLGLLNQGRLGSPKRVTSPRVASRSCAPGLDTAFQGSADSSPVIGMRRARDEEPREGRLVLKPSVDTGSPMIALKPDLASRWSLPLLPRAPAAFRSALQGARTSDSSRSADGMSALKEQCQSPKGQPWARGGRSWPRAEWAAVECPTATSRRSLLEIVGGR
jgi:hypothetical protein